MILAGIVVYLAILVAIGIVAARRMKDVRDYYAAGKRLNFLAVAFSARATGESAWLLLGLTGMGAAIGVKAFWVVVGELLGVGVAWILLSRRFKRLTDRYDSITVPDYLEARFRDRSHRLRLVSAGALLVFVTIYVSAQIDATGTAFTSFLGWNYYTGALVGFGVVMAYIIGGGFLAVVWSDIFQGAMMFLGLVSLPIIGLAAAGGWTPVAEGLRLQDPGLLSVWGPEGFSTLNVFAILSLALIGLGFLGSPQIFVRFLALRSEREIPRGTAVAITWTLLADTGAVLTGLVGRHLLMGPGDDVAAVLGASGQDVLPALTSLVLPVVFVGVMIAVVLAAIMSTVDSLLVVASSAYVRDYYQKVRHPELPDDALVGRSRVATAVLALVALGVAMTVALTTPDRTIFWFVVFGWSGIAATFCPTMLLSLFWKGMTTRGALAAMITGFACVPLFKFAAPHLPVVGDAFNALEELPPSFLVSGVVGIIVSLGDRRGRVRLAGVEEELRAAGK
ncbi:MAG: sodium/proline symporter [Phycisphaerales bacterium]|nr:sodium/proline symporter [Phycisphaerales bacterium]